MKKQTWTIRELLEWTTAHFQEKNIPEARVNVEWLLAHTLSMRRFDLYVNFDRPLNTTELAGFRSLVQRRIKREPLQYIIGSADFMGLTFQLQSGVLIPRPETELLVEAALSVCETENRPFHILDIGVGSGCISVSMAFYLGKKQIPAKISGVDISAKAIETARNNAEQLVAEADLTLYEGDIRLINAPGKLEGPFDMILSNPPYIPTHEIRELQPEVGVFEPVEALDGGPDGLSYYKHIIRLAPTWLKTDPLGYLILEAGSDQAATIGTLMAEQGFAVKKIKDYNHVDRVITGRKARS